MALRDAVYKSVTYLLVETTRQTWIADVTHSAQNDDIAIIAAVISVSFSVVAIFVAFFVILTCRKLKSRRG